MVAEMRRIMPADLKISNVDGGRLHDGRIHGPMNFRPFANTQEFHRYLRGGVEAYPDNPHEVNELISQQDEP
jgi:thiamine kinase-like enzyme